MKGSKLLARGENKRRRTVAGGRQAEKRKAKKSRRIEKAKAQLLDSLNGIRKTDLVDVLEALAADTEFKSAFECAQQRLCGEGDWSNVD
jgi:hypothetical protein